MWWDKKSGPIVGRNLHLPQAPTPVPSPVAELEKPMSENKPPAANLSSGSKQTYVGQSVTLHGQLSGNEDLHIEGQFEGTIHLRDHCLTVGSQGQVKAEIQARQVVVLGSVNGNISARDKIEIRKTGHIVGDLVAAGVAIEEGAYLKGSIDIQRDEAETGSRSVSVPSALKTTA